ncbi:phytase [Luteipulveratus halotolerans]|uniref:BPP domain-containing protein n=1 Tax=Luteipulveratus halotolerans TaxID=1631356 RepID=A0A0L6CJJ2_9MICO|nr:phytase [Luteipulveratus halotolerans]KNX37785.1 hypothetical protein VV01_12510 [Luteipulveratus halotolerans]
MKTSLLTASVAVALLAATATAPAHARPTPDGPVAVTTDNETPALYDDEQGGNASGDDPAIWVHPHDSRRSVVLATAKEGGLRVYDLRSRELQSLPATAAPRADGVAGRYNNVDIAYGMNVRGRTVDLAVVSDRYNDQLRFFTIDPAGSATRQPLTEVTAPELGFLFNPDRDAVGDEHTAYGVSVWQPRPGEAYAVITQEGTTRIATARITSSTNGVGYSDVQHLSMPGSFALPDGTTWTPCEEPGTGPQLEGLGVDQDTSTLYAAQEDVGLWRVPLPLGTGQPRLVDKVTDFGIQDRWNPETEECDPVGPDRGLGGHLLTADAEGVDVYDGPGRTGYVVVSSQGDDTFAVYGLTGRNRAVGSFRIRGVDGADDVNGSDGLAIASRPVGPYTRGLLVSHDEPETGADVDPERDATNFSYVGWGSVADALGLTAVPR